MGWVRFGPGVRRRALGFLVLALTAAGAGRAEEWSAAALREVNAARGAAGLSPLARAPELDLAALRHASDMARGDFLSHTGSDRSDPATRIREAGYPALAWAENVAAGYRSAESVVAAWMKSPGHRANLLSDRFAEIGIAVVYRPGTRFGAYWALVLGARAPVTTPEASDSGDSAAALADPTDRLLTLVNDQRRAAGLALLRRAPELDEAARRHTRDMAERGFFGHIGSDGTSAGDRLRAAGYAWTTWGENVAAGFPTADGVLGAWMQSPAHRDNLLSPAFREIGLAFVSDPRSPWGTYWTATFAAPAGR